MEEDKASTAAPPPPESEIAYEKAMEDMEKSEAELIEQEVEESDSGDRVVILTGKKKLKKREEKPKLPRPYTRHFKDENQDPRAKSDKFFLYWKTLWNDPDIRDRIVVYVYRIWPVMKKDFRQVDKCFEPLNGPEDLLRAYGCGDYNLKLKDALDRSEGAINCTITNIGSRQLTEHPPVLDLEGLELDDPLNRSYLVWCRSRGIQIPGDSGYVSEKGDEVATVEAVKELTSTVTRMTDRMLDAADEKIKLADALAKTKKEDNGDSVVAKTLDIVKVATESASSIVKQGVEQALKVQNADPAETMRNVVNMAKELMPKQDEASKNVIQLIMERDKQYVDKVFQIQQERISAMERLLEQQLIAKTTAANPAAAPAPAPATPATSLSQVIEEMAEMRDKMRRALGLDEEAEKPSKSWTDYLPQIIAGLTTLGTAISAGLYNLAVSKTGQGAPVNPLQAAQPEAQEMMGNPMSAPAPENATPSGEGNTMTRFTQFLSMVQRPLLRSFTEGESGADFAARLIELTDDGMFGPNAQGRQVYDAVLEFGEALVASMIKTYPPIWNVVSQTPQKWERFLHEFFTADQIWAAEDAAESTPAPAPSPVASMKRKTKSTM